MRSLPALFSVMLQWFLNLLVESLCLDVASLEVAFKRDIPWDLCGCVSVLPLGPSKTVLKTKTWAVFLSWRVWCCCSSLAGEALQVGIS